MRKGNLRPLSWRYVRGGHLGRLVSAEPRPVQQLREGVFHPVHLPVRVQAVVWDHDTVWVTTLPEASTLGDGMMTAVTPPCLLRYQPTGWRYITYYHGHDGFLPSFAADGALWGLDTEGVAFYHGDTRTTLPTRLGSPMTQLMRDRQGSFWGCTLAGDIWHSTDARSWLIARQHRSQHVWRLISPHEQSGVWLTELKRGPRRSGATGLWQSTRDQATLQAIHPLPHPVEPTCVCEDTTGRLWIGTDAAGLFSFDGSAWTRYARVTYETPYGLPSRSIKTIFQDQQQRIWAITDGGAAVFTGQRWLTVYILLATSTTVLVWKDGDAVAATDRDPFGRIWLGTDRGDVGWLDTQQPLEQFSFIPDAYEPLPIKLPQV
jgi:hypothetical protein